MCFGSFSIFTVLAFVVGNYLLIARSLHENAHKQLRERVQTVDTAAETVLDAAVRSYLRGVVDQDILLLDTLYADVKAGRITRQQAEDAFQKHVLPEVIGRSGYIAAMHETGGNIRLVIHPYMRGRSCADNQGCRDWIRQKEGYSEYDWQNPEDRSVRQKVAYIRYFEPWDWVIGATSYKDEFTELVRADDLRSLIESQRVLQNGYFFVMDSAYNMLIHPAPKGPNAWEAVNSEGVYVVQEMMKHLNEFYEYRWQNPSDPDPQDKFALLTRLPHFDWYVGAAGFTDDIEAPIRPLMWASYALLALVALVLIAITAAFSRSLTRPLTSLTEGLKAFRNEGRVFRFPFRSVAELDSVGRAMEEITENLAAAEVDKKNLLAQLDGIVASMPSMLVGLDADHRVIVWNEKAAEYTGIGRTEALGRDVRDALSRFVCTLDPIARSLLSDRPWAGACPVVRSGKPTSHYDVSLFPLHAGRLSAVIRIDDVSNRVHMEEGLARSQKLEAIGTLAGGIAHDFNNILAAILGYAELVEARLPEQSDTREMQSRVVTAAERARELVRQILLFSRQAQEETRAILLHPIIDEALKLLRSSMPATIAFETNVDRNCARVLADPTQIHQIVMNLGTNAYHAMRDRGGTLSVSLAPVDITPQPDETDGIETVPPGSYVRLEVRDTGHGMDAATRERIFDPFFTTRGPGEGTGLGLSVVLGIVQSFDGHIQVDTAEGGGTRFRILFPALSASDEEDDAHAQKTRPPVGAERIMVVDDEPLVLDVTRRTLEELGYTVTAFQDSREALATLRAGPYDFDLVITDMTMPHLTGIELTGAVRALRSTLPVIACTGYSEPVPVDKAKAVGIVDYLHKPIRLSELAQAVRQALDATKG